MVANIESARNRLATTGVFRPATNKFYNKETKMYFRDIETDTKAKQEHDRKMKEMSAARRSKSPSQRKSK